MFVQTALMIFLLKIVGYKRNYMDENRLNQLSYEHAIDVYFIWSIGIIVFPPSTSESDKTKRHNKWAKKCTAKWNQNVMLFNPFIAVLRLIAINSAVTAWSIEHENYIRSYICEEHQHLDVKPELKFYFVLCQFDILFCLNCSNGCILILW